MPETVFYGWYDDASQAPDQPTYDPPHDAPCLFCGLKITGDDIRTHSIMLVESTYAKRCYFYRTHRTCDEQEPSKMDAAIWEMIARNGD
jgi:hypothetical protein